MAAQFGRNGRRVAAAAVLSLAMGGMVAMAQDAGAPPPPAQQQEGQGPPPGGGMHGRGGPERQVEMLTKRLNLTPDQVTQVKAIDMDAMTQAKAVHSDTSLSQDDRRSKTMSIHEAAQTKIRAVLNDEQKTKFDAMMAHRRDHMQHGEGQGAPPPPPAQ